MLHKLKRFFEATLLADPSDKSAVNVAQSIEYATAALMFELANADSNESIDEQDLIITLLSKTFSLDPNTLVEIQGLAKTAASDSHDLYQFTSLVNTHYGNAEKMTLLENLWKLAYADGQLDKHESHFIKKIAGLINLPPSALMKTKHSVQKHLNPLDN